MKKYLSIQNRPSVGIAIMSIGMSIGGGLIASAYIQSLFGKR